MVKHSLEPTKPIEEACNKRQRLSDFISTLSTHTEKITSGKNLHQLLSFDQNPRQSTINIQSFKSFLDDIIASKDHSFQLQIIEEYFEIQKSLCLDQNHDTFLIDLIQTWSFALQSNSESLLSIVPTVLTLLLRIISGSLKLLTYGEKLGKTLLHKNQQELIKRGLTANKNKEHVISPVLRLLRELTIFDAGALANNIFRARSVTFQALTRNLGLAYSSDRREDFRKPSVRTNATRFILQLMKYLSTELKRDLLNQRDIIFALTQHIFDDPPFLIREVLGIFKMHVLKDQYIPRETKTKFLNLKLLGKIGSLYHYDQLDQEDESSASLVPDCAHKFLVDVCTSPDSGLLIKQSGLYPRGYLEKNLNSNFTDLNSRQIDLGIEGIELIYKYTKKVPIKNVILSGFIRSLRPWTSTKQTELVISIFRAVPELIADYFLAKNNTFFDPKLTATWVGYSNFVYNTIELPPPHYFGHEKDYAHLPPPISIMMEHLIPCNFNQKSLIRCFSQSTNEFVAFLATRILCISFQKLDIVLRMCREASQGSLTSIWMQYISLIIENFTNRCPEINHVINAYRRLDSTKVCQHEAYTRLISLYFELLPRSALEVNSVISAIITENLLNVEKINLKSQDGLFRALELENIFRIAGFSPGVKWFSSGSNFTISPYLAMLKLFALAPPGVPWPRLKSVLISVTQESQILQIGSMTTELEYFIVSLRTVMTDHEISSFHEYLDSCISRCAVTPLKYIFKLEELISETKSENLGPSPSLISIALLEQWPFHIKAVNVSILRKTAIFISKHLASSIKLMKDRTIINSLAEKFIAACPNDLEAQKIIRSYREATNEITMQHCISVSPFRYSESKNESQVLERQVPNVTEQIESEILSENDDALVKWRNKEIEDVIHDGLLGDLIVLLSSNHLSIRMEALTSIKKLTYKLKDSGFEEKDQISLLLQELTESVEATITQGALPRIFSSFAYHATNVLKDPSHPLYPKINTFLSQRPIWQLNKIPLFHRIMDETPSVDTAIYSERKWLLDFMCDGIHLKADLEIFCKRGIFERLLSCYNIYFDRRLQEKILDIFNRACLITEGSTALVTRLSLATWLDIHQALLPTKGLKNLQQTLYNTCSHKRIRKWSRGTIKSK